jgi:F1F0 ATPase subunit 2
MNDPLDMTLSLATGILLGIFYFGGLWLTLKRLSQSRQPALLTLASFLMRSLVCLSGFYLVAGKGLEALAFCLAGFIALKFALIYRMNSTRSEADRW